MLNLDGLKKLYASYDFEFNGENLNVFVFIYTKSRYFGVDIIPLNNEIETIQTANCVKDGYSFQGFAVNLKEVSSNQEAEIELFKSFFSFDSTIERLKRKYKEFCRRQTQNLLGSVYKYIESPYELQNHSYEEDGLFEIIQSRFSSAKPELIIIEAAAGYGKTCTAYEILNRISNTSNFQTPIFTELSRNRGVKKFKYILLDEIDIEYPSLNSALVKKEIKNGRIPIIIDGFDELLEKVHLDSSTDNSFEEVETMLDTIGSLLEFKSKIILTTRKTAIFTGEEFENWIQKWDEKFNVTRISLKEPRLKDWLGANKYLLIKQKNVPIQNLANPVILSFLKNSTDEVFQGLIENSEMLVEEYFQRMLEREKDRQNLRMTVDKQLEVFKNVAKMLLEFDSTSEEKEFFKEMILDSNRKLLEYTRTLYSGDDKHTIETLLDSLATHALLDRKGRYENEIGFINDFVFGTFIGQIIIDSTDPKIEKNYSTYMIELAVTAFRVQSKKKRAVLWEKIQINSKQFSNEIAFTFDIYLKEGLVRDYTELYIYDITFYNIQFTEFVVSSSVFLNCIFKNCVFEVEKLNGISFINCMFDNCAVKDESFIDSKNEITTIKCLQDNCSLLIDKITHFENESDSEVSDFEKHILSKLWNISNKKGHHISKLTRLIDKNKPREIFRSLQSLQEKRFVDIRGIHVYFVTNKIPVIKEILGLANEL